LARFGAREYLIEPLKLLYRDVDRTPLLYAIQHAARERGINLDVALQTGREYGELVLRGEADLLAENYYNLQTYRARGAPLVSLATSVTWLNEKLLVTPDVQSFDDLRGRVFAIRGQGPQELINRLWLRDMGLHDALQIVVVSEDEMGRWGQWRKVVSGDASGTFVTHLYADEPLAAGLKELPFEPYGFIGNMTLTTSRATLAAKHNAMERVVRAFFDAVRLFKAEREHTLDIMRGEPARLLAAERVFQLERVYEVVRHELSDAPIPSPQGIVNTHRMMLGRAPELAGYNPLLGWDLTIAAAIVDEQMTG
jgi:ABC-type nitrate/sulfonate/bicarbonate transport system substrate-binding protein